MSENALACTWPELRQRGKEFCDFAPTATSHEELDGLWSGFALGYLNLEKATPSEQHQAVLLLQILGREKIKHEVRLDHPTNGIPKSLTRIRDMP